MAQQPPFLSWEDTCVFEHEGEATGEGDNDDGDVQMTVLKQGPTEWSEARG